MVFVFLAIAVYHGCQAPFPCGSTSWGGRYQGTRIVDRLQEPQVKAVPCTRGGLWINGSLLVRNGIYSLPRVLCNYWRGRENCIHSPMLPVGDVSIGGPMTEDKMGKLVNGEVVEDAGDIYAEYLEDPSSFWLHIADEYAARGDYDAAQEILEGLDENNDV